MSANESMFIKICKAEFKRRKFLLSYNKPEVFTRCYFQKSDKVIPIWIAYHAFMAVYILATFAYTLVPSAHHNPESLGKYYIFLTHWVYDTQIVYFVLGLIIVAYTAFKERKNDLASINTLESGPSAVGSSASQQHNRMTWYLKIYWILHNIVAPGALTVTLIFWLFIYNPEQFVIDAINLIHHAFNSLIVIIHVILISHPIRFLHFYIPLLFGALYTLFTIIYQLSGGTGTKGQIPIYKILDWNKPYKTIIVCLLVTVLLIFLHFLFFVLSFFKSYMKKRKTKNMEDAR